MSSSAEITRARREEAHRQRGRELGEAAQVAGLDVALAHRERPHQEAVPAHRHHRHGRTSSPAPAPPAWRRPRAPPAATSSSSMRRRGAKIATIRNAAAPTSAWRTRSPLGEVAGRLAHRGSLGCHEPLGKVTSGARGLVARRALVGARQAHGEGRAPARARSSRRWCRRASQRGAGRSRGRARCRPAASGCRRPAGTPGRSPPRPRARCRRRWSCTASATKLPRASMFTVTQPWVVGLDGVGDQVGEHLPPPARRRRTRKSPALPGDRPAPPACRAPRRAPRAPPPRPARGRRPRGGLRRSWPVSRAERSRTSSMRFLRCSPLVADDPHRLPGVGPERAVDLGLEDVGEAEDGVHGRAQLVGGAPRGRPIARAAPRGGLAEICPVAALGGGEAGRPGDRRPR